MGESSSRWGKGVDPGQARALHHARQAADGMSPSNPILATMMHPTRCVPCRQGRSARNMQRVKDFGRGRKLEGTADDVTRETGGEVLGYNSDPEGRIRGLDLQQFGGGQGLCEEANSPLGDVEDGSFAHVSVLILDRNAHQQTRFASVSSPLMLRSVLLHSSGCLQGQERTGLRARRAKGPRPSSRRS
jgi:hypothetical protein